GTTLFDHTANHLDGTLGGGTAGNVPQWVAVSAESLTAPAGVLGNLAPPVTQALALDGATDVVSVADSPTVRPASFTIEGWVNLSTVNGFQPFFSKPVGGVANDSMQVWYQGGSLNAALGSSSGTSSITFGWAPSVNTWYHVAYAVTYAGTS